MKTIEILKFSQIVIQVCFQCSGLKIRNIPRENISLYTIINQLSIKQVFGRVVVFIKRREKAKAIR